MYNLFKEKIVKGTTRKMLYHGGIILFINNIQFQNLIPQGNYQIKIKCPQHVAFDEASNVLLNNP